MPPLFLSAFAAPEPGRPRSHSQGDRTHTLRAPRAPPRLQGQPSRHKQRKPPAPRLQPRLSALASCAPELLAGMQSQGLFASFALDFGIQWAAWAVAALLKTETFYDAIGSVTFLTLALRSLLFGVAAAQPRSRLVTGLVCAWALRLGTFLVRRIRKDGGRDSRFDGVRDRPAKFLAFWTVQGVWVALTLLPCLLLNDTASQPPLGWTDALGLAIWVTGFTLEATADAQKSTWKANAANHGKFIDVGLWRLARHPNYGGEITLWWGALIIASGGLSGGAVAAACLGPAFVTFLLTKVSGVPLLERAARKRWGADPAYAAYRQRTRLLLPLPRLGRKAQE